jgi:hypothetical protein
MTLPLSPRPMPARHRPATPSPSSNQARTVASGMRAGRAQTKRRGTTAAATVLSERARRALASLLPRSRRQDVPDLPRCASCQTTEGLLPDEGAGVVFCAPCAAPIGAITFPEFYLDLVYGD